MSTDRQALERLDRLEVSPDDEKFSGRARAADPKYLKWGGGSLILVVLLGLALNEREAVRGFIDAARNAIVTEAAVKTARAAFPVAPGPRKVLSGSGYVVAKLSATVSAKITGRITAVFVEEGAVLSEGDRIAQLEDDNLRADRGAAMAHLAAARARLRMRQAHIEEAERRFARAKALADEGLASQAHLDSVATRLNSLRAEIDVMRSDIKVANSSLAIAQIALESTTIRAPFDGVVTFLSAHPGEIVSPMSASGGFTRSGIATLVDMQSLQGHIHVAETKIGRVYPGQSVEVVLDAYPDWKLPAEVTRIDSSADRLRATIGVTLTFDVASERIRPDMGIQAWFLERESSNQSDPAVVIPTGAVANDSLGPYVYLIRGGRAIERRVVLGESHGEQVEILEGLRSGETVVTSAPEELQDGMKVSTRLN